VAPADAQAFWARLPLTKIVLNNRSLLLSWIGVASRGERQSMWHRLLRIGGLRILVVRPASLHLGHLVLETKNAMVTAKRMGAVLYLVRPPKVANPSVFELRMSGVRQIANNNLADKVLDAVALKTDRKSKKAKRRKPLKVRGLAIGTAALLLYRRMMLQVWRLSELGLALLRSRGSGASDWTNAAKERKRLEAKRIGALKSSRQKNVAVDFSLRRWWQSQWDRWRAIYAENGDRIYPIGEEGGPYFQRRLIADDTPIQFRDGALSKAWSLAETIGLGGDMRIVTLHVREPGFKHGQEVQDKGAWNDPLWAGRDDSTRNADIQNYKLAVDWLVSQGYRVVRLGDPSMVPVDWDGVIDLARSPNRHPYLDFLTVQQSEFIIGSDSGPAVIAWLFGVPLLYANVTHVGIGWPIGARDLILPKHVYCLREGRFLRLEETLTEEHADNFRSTKRYRYVENGSRDLLWAVQDMVKRASTTTKPDETVAQAAFREACTRYMGAPGVTKGARYFRKWGADHGYLGDGSIPQFVMNRNAVSTWAPEPEGEAPPARSSPIDPREESRERAQTRDAETDGLSLTPRAN
jgi:putative glycosyltransferase (TIGR04372 family)